MTQYNMRELASAGPEKLQALLDDSDISTAEKVTILEDWRVDLLERQVATEENMPAAESDENRTAQMLRRVTNALEELKP